MKAPLLDWEKIKQVMFAPTWVDDKSPTLVVGPEDSGKTLYLAALYQSVLREKERVKALLGTEIELQAKNDEAQAVVDAFSEFVLGTAIGSTTAGTVPELRFRLRVKLPGPFGPPRMSDSECYVPEHKGGALFSQFQDPKMIAKVAESKRIMFCIDIANPKAIVQYWRFLQRVVKARNYSKWQRVLVAITKADRYAARMNWELGDLLPRNAALELASRVPRETIQLLKDSCSGKVGVVFCSAFGFLENGRPNSNVTGTSLAGDLSDDEKKLDAIMNWEPFQTIEPFLYLSGVRMPGIWDLD